MSEQDKKSGGPATGGSSVVMVEQSTPSRHKQPYRPTDLQDEVPDHHKRSRAPAVPTVPSEKHKQNVAKKMSATKKRENSPEPISSPPIELELKKTETIALAATTQPTQPIPAPVPSTAVDIVKGRAERKSDEDSITEEIAELRTPEPLKKSGEWSDDEEASGLPRSDSRASRTSRMSRAVRQLFCCGVAYEAPSEEDVVSPRRGGSGGI